MMDKFDKEKIARLKDWAEGKKRVPFYLCIRPSYQCNLNCISCIDHPKKEGNAVSDRRYIALVKEAISLGIKELRIDGGAEPLMRLDLIKKIVKLAKKSNLKGFLTTNATLFDEDLIDNLVKLKWDVVNVSMQGDTPKLDNYLRGEKAFENTVKALKLFKEYKRRYNSKKPDVRITVLVHKMNYNKLPNFIKLAYKYNAGMTVQAFALWSEKGRKLRLTQGDYKFLPRYVIKANKLANKLGVYTEVESLLEQNLLENTNSMDKVISEDIKGLKVENAFLKLPCFEPWYFMMITEFGTIARCIGDFDGAINIENRTLKEIWRSKYYNNLRKKLLNNEIPEFCKRCCMPQIVETRTLRNWLIKEVEKA